MDCAIATRTCSREAWRQARLHGLLHKGCDTCLKELPAVNAEIDGNDIIYKNYCHVGMAVGTDKGLSFRYP